MKKCIAIVEDEVSIAENYRDALERRGYDIHLYRNRPDAETAFARKLPDLVIIDIELGDEHDGGFDLCMWLRKKSEALPIIFVTARDNEVDKILGSKLGGFEYLTKNESLDYLLARIDAMFRMIANFQQAPANETVIERGDLTINNDRFCLFWKGTRIDVALAEFWIVECLAQFPGHIKTRQQLMDAAKLTVSGATINTYIKRLRKKFRDADPDADPIKAEYGKGYRWQI